MQIEYSNEIKGKVFAYRFTGKEEKIIAECLKPYLKVLDKKIKKIENNPKNEGQVTFEVQIEELLSEKKDIEEIIKEFS